MFKNLVSLHYHKEFKNRSGTNPIGDLLNATGNGRLINKTIKEFGLIQKETRLTIFTGRLRRRLAKFLKHSNRK